MAGHDTDKDQGTTRNRTSPSAGGMATPTTGSPMGTAEKDPVVNEEASTQENPAEHVLSPSDQRQTDGEDASKNPDAPEHGGYGRPV